SNERYKSVVATFASTNITPSFNTLISKKILSSCSPLMVDVARQCYHIYLETYGLSIDATGRLPPFQFYLHASSMYPFEQICGPSNALMSCINSRVSSACVNIAMFRVLTYSDEDAYNYLGAYAAFEYICGKGYTEFVSNQQCFIRASSDPAIDKQLQSCGITVDSTDPTVVCNSALIDALCIRGIYEDYCGPQLAHGICETRVNFLRRLNITDENCLDEMSARCNSANDYMITTKFIAIFAIFFIYSL
uniref:Uncharacterized protein n=1 Tax=Parascaris univalens TaxID=6257 RepID=A0A915C936_PARUN